MNPLQNKPKVDISALSPEERTIFEKYGKVPGHKFGNKLQERKYFDSADYSLSQAGVASQEQVGSAIPSPADIPHASPPSSAHGVGVQPGTSPTGSQTTMSHSPGKEPIGTHRSDNMTFDRQA